MYNLNSRLAHINALWMEHTFVSNWNLGGISCDVRFAGHLRSNRTNAWSDERNIQMCRVRGGTEIENRWVNYSTPFQNTLPQRRLGIRLLFAEYCQSKASRFHWDLNSDRWIQSANHYTMEPSSSKGECPSVFSVEMTQKEALRKAADPLASVWCPKSTTGSPLPKARIKAGTFKSSV